jgi:UDP:flavonoid glycosyltransferase YjiC (YdhE family)
MSDSREAVSPQIAEVFEPKNGKVKSYCTVGSSGSKIQLLEIINVFTAKEGLEWNAVILSPSSVCPIEEAKAALGDRKGVFITSEFIPAQAVNALADVVVCHGGQLRQSVSEAVPR